MKEFKTFVLRGNVVDLAVGVVVGAAFGAVVSSLVQDVLTPLTGIFGTPDFGELRFSVGKASVAYGNFLNTAIAFLMVSAAVFFFVVKPVNRLMGMTKGAESPAVKDCPHCMNVIPARATRCGYCTSEV